MGLQADRQAVHACMGFESDITPASAVGGGGEGLWAQIIVSPPPPPGGLGKREVLSPGGAKGV